MTLSRRMRAEEDAAGVRKKKRNHHSLRPPRDPDQPAPPVPSFTPPPDFLRLDGLMNGVCSDDYALQLDATTRFKNMLSMTIGFRVAIDVVDNAGLIPRFIEFLGRDDQPELQLEAAWALTNVACGNSAQTTLLTDLGAVGLFVNCLSSGTYELKKHAVWALGNIAGESPSCRDIVLDHDALSSLLLLLNSDSEISMLRVATWTLCNFCHGNPHPVNFELVRPALPLLQQLIQSNDKDILAEACWALSYLSDGPIEKIQAVVDLGVCPRLVEILQDVLDDDVIIPVIRTLGHIAAGGDDLTQLVIDSQALPCLYQLLTRSRNRFVLKEVCWTISNITAGNGAQKMACMEANLILPLIFLIHYADFDIRREAAWAISNATSTGADDQQILMLVFQGCIQPLCDLLLCADPTVVRVCLEGLENILYVGEDYKEEDGLNPFAQMVEQSGGLVNIYFLLTYHTNENFERSMVLMERFWSDQYDLGDLYDIRNGLQNLSLEVNQPDLSQALDDSDI